MVRASFPEASQHLQIATDAIARCSAAAVVRLGEQLLGQGESTDPGLLEPRYIKEFFLSTTHQQEAPPCPGSNAPKRTSRPKPRKREIPDGLWTKCEQCGEIIHKTELEKSFYTCAKCNAHFRIGSKEYVEILLDPGSLQGIRQADALRRSR